MTCAGLIRWTLSNHTTGIDDMKHVITALLVAALAVAGILSVGAAEDDTNALKAIAAIAHVK